MMHEVSTVGGFQIERQFIVYSSSYFSLYHVIKYGRNTAVFAVRIVFSPYRTY